MKIELTQQEITLIKAALNELPRKICHSLYIKIEKQEIEQLAQDLSKNQNESARKTTV